MNETYLFFFFCLGLTDFFWFSSFYTKSVLRRVIWGMIMKHFLPLNWCIWWKVIIVRVETKTSRESLSTKVTIVEEQMENFCNMTDPFVNLNQLKFFIALVFLIYLLNLLLPKIIFHPNTTLFQNPCHCKVCKDQKKYYKI